MSIRQRCPWYYFPWALVVGFFVVGPLSAGGVFLSPAISFGRKLRFGLFLLLCGFALYQLSDHFRTLLYHRESKRYTEERNAFRYEQALLVLQSIKPSKELDKLDILLEKNSLYNSLGRVNEAQESFAKARVLFLAQAENSLSAPLSRTVSNEVWQQNFTDLFYSFLVNKLYFPSQSQPSTEIKQFISMRQIPILRIVAFSGTQEELEELLFVSYQLCAMNGFGYGRNTLEFYLLFYLLKFRPECIFDFEKARNKKILSEVQTFASGSPYNLAARYLTAMTRERLGQYQEALSDYLFVFMLDTRFFDVLFRIKQLRRRLDISTGTQFLDDYLEAEDRRFFKADFSKSLLLFNSLLEDSALIKEYSTFEEEILFNMGVIYRNNTKEYEKAVQVFRRIVDFRSFRTEEALYNLTMSYLSLGREKECETYLQELLYRFPQTHHRRRLIIIRFYLQIKAVAQKYFNSLLRQTPKGARS